jgi:hypothetical protein
VTALGVSPLLAFSQETLQNPAGVASATPTQNLTLPEGNGTWVMLVRRTGGFAGIAVEAILNSERKFTCASCRDQSVSRTLSQTAFQSAVPSFSFGIVPLDEPVASPASPAPVSFCMDCFTTHIRIQRRDAQGKIETYAASWTDVTAAAAPPEFVKLARTIIDLAK